MVHEILGILAGPDEEARASIGGLGMDYPITLKIEPPQTLSRLTTLLRIFMVIPHAIIVYFLGIVAGVLLFLSWWAILFTGKYPKAFFDYMAWYWPWSTRVTGYMYLLTDKYPPFAGGQ